MTGGGRGQVRRDRRSRGRGLTAQARWAPEAPWRDVRLYDLSIGGALLSTQEKVDVRQRFELRVVRARDDLALVLVAEALRGVERADGSAIAVRFVALSAEAARTLTRLLDEGAADEAPDHDEDAPRGAGASAEDEGPVPALSTLRLHDVSLYDLLELDATCADGELESKCEALIADVARMAREAVGRREERLRILHQSLERMRPLWSDPIKRARYDLRWGYVHADARLRDAEAGNGVHPHILAGIWFDLYPDSVRLAERLVQTAEGPEELRAALVKAVTELAPFDRKKRSQLAALEGKAPVDRAGGEVPMVRGNLADLPLASLLRSAAADGADAEVVVRVDGKAIGVVGLTQGDIVTAICGEARGASALRALASVRAGTFQVVYAPPREHLRHMREPAAALLEDAAAR